MEIVNVGYDYHHPSGFYIDRPHGSGDYMLLIIKTEAFAVLNGKRLTVTPNSALVFKKGTPQLYGATHNEYVNDWIHFELCEAEERALSELGILFDTVIPLQESIEFSDFIKKILLERYSKNLHKKQSMQRYFDLIFLKLAEKIAEPSFCQENPHYHLFCQMRNRISVAPQKPWSIDEISNEMHLSRSYVQHLYKNFFHISIVSDIQNHRIEHAKYLLSSTDMKIGNIAVACGYQNEFHFMRIFKKVTRLTPSAFRNEFQLSPKSSKNRKMLI
jgi:AraC family transcriptional regulator of arabinose operon